MAEEQPDQNRGKPQQDAGQRQSLPEKVTLFVTLAVVLALMGYIAWYGVAVEKGPPMIEARVLPEKARRRGGQWAIPVEIKNISDLPLEDVHVKVEMTAPDGERTDIEITVPYLAEGGSENAYVVTQDPQKAAPKATVESFKQKQGSQGY
jgi:uncharacterized protein (TIGR02588 family)